MPCRLAAIRTVAVAVWVLASARTSVPARTIVLMGDSQAYSGSMARGLRQFYAQAWPDSSVEVISAGFNAETVKSALDKNRIETCIKQYAPDLILINYGINDLGQGQDFAYNCRLLLDRIDEHIPDAIVGFVSPILGDDPSYDTIADEIERRYGRRIDIRLQAARSALHRPYAGGSWPFYPWISSLENVHISDLTGDIYAATIASGLGGPVDPARPVTLGLHQLAPEDRRAAHGRQAGDTIRVDFGTPFMVRVAPDLPDAPPPSAGTAASLKRLPAGMPGRLAAAGRARLFLAPPGVRSPAGLAYTLRGRRVGRGVAAARGTTVVVNRNR